MAALPEAMEENVHAHIAYVSRRTPGMYVQDAADLLLVDSGLSTDTFNKIARARLGGDADARIAYAIGHFRAAGRPFAWWVGPCSRPADLGARLERHGLAAAESELGMTMDLAQLPEAMRMPKGLVVRRARTAAEIADFAGVMAACWDPPDHAVLDFFAAATPLLAGEDCPMQLFTGYLGGVPAAGSELMLAGGVAGIHMVATRREYQRRGIAIAVSWHALQAGRRAGLSIAALQASEEGEPVYAKLGFRACCRFVEYR